MYNHYKIREITTIALLTAFITISGALKLPGFFPGTEFQLSAPIAVAICGIFGIKKYLIAGILSSILGLILGTQIIFSVLIAMIFRIVVAFVFFLIGDSKLFYVISGPLGTLTARLCMSIIVGKTAMVLVIAALPGMIYTALSAGFIAVLLKRIVLATNLKTTTN
jgi:hypothetical protein